MGRRFLGVLLAVAVAAPSFGCVLRGPSGIHREIANGTGAAYEREFGVTIGPLGMAIARWGMRMAEEHGDEEVVSLRGIRKVQVGVYHVKPGTWKNPRKTFAPKLLRDWEPVVHLRDDGEDVHVLLRSERDSIRAMLVVVSEEDELVIVKLRGRLDELLRDALELGLDHADRGDRFEEAAERLEDHEAAGSTTPDT